MAYTEAEERCDHQTAKELEQESRSGTIETFRLHKEADQGGGFCDLTGNVTGSPPKTPFHQPKGIFPV